MTPPAVYDHFVSTDTAHSDGIYRVVGTSEDSVTLLRVANADGRRSHTGRIVTVSHGALDSLVPVENPDGNRPLGETVSSALETAYWSARVFVQQLAAHPLMTVLALTFITTGYFGEGIGPLSDGVSSILVVVGSLLLAYIGSARL